MFLLGTQVPASTVEFLDLLDRVTNDATVGGWFLSLHTEAAQSASNNRITHSVVYETTWFPALNAYFGNLPQN